MTLLIHDTDHSNIFCLWLHGTILKLFLMSSSQNEVPFVHKTLGISGLEASP